MKTTYEEGDICPNCGEGSLWINADENAIIHEHAPIVFPLKCDKCGYTVEEDE